MKIAVVGKGGVGKTTIAATMARLFARDGYNVLAIDADPNLNLASSLGIPENVIRKIIPLSENIKFIRSRVKSFFGGVMSYTPKVNDVIDKFAVTGPDGVRLLVMGTVRAGGVGCMCPENAFLRALLSHILLARRELVILDMVAGLEHLGRGTAKGVDLMLCIVEPSIKAIETAKRIYKLAKEIEVKEIVVVGNKVSSTIERKFIEKELSKSCIDILGYVPFDETVIKADMFGKSLLDYNPYSRAIQSIKRIKEIIIERYLSMRLH